KRKVNDDRMARWRVDSAAAVATARVAMGNDSSAAGQVRFPRRPALAEMMVADEIPDYWPASAGGSGALLVDDKGRAWIKQRPLNVGDGSTLYDVIGRDGKLVERVRIPIGATIAAFGHDGRVYILRRDGDAAVLSAHVLR